MSGSSKGSNNPATGDGARSRGLLLATVGRGDNGVPSFRRSLPMAKQEERGRKREVNPDRSQKSSDLSGPSAPPGREGSERFEPRQQEGQAGRGSESERGSQPAGPSGRSTSG